ncbi:serine arginine repetitive matrix 1 [Moniliophthora roreri]|uniref:Uncharacterized protein n=1 Tax=Moniliophthora roreri TaxID=221103 RepID=A0A0W0F5X4_MONRR|nr:serine arginine repetitive matrix 1 [Moniliophthora roreri]
MVTTTEQAHHDEINLSRLLRRLEKSVTEESWDTPSDSTQATWLKSEENLQKVKFAKKLLRNVEASQGSSDKNSEIRKSLNRMETFLKSVNERTKPPTQRPKPILPTLPVPVEPSQPEPSSPDQDTELPSESPETDNLLGSPADPIPIAPGPSLVSSMPTLIPPSMPSAASKSTAIATGTLQHSNALQEELSNQLAQMSAQLRRNAIHFSESLAKDAAVLEGAKEKLESNYDVMTKNKDRLKEHSSKSSSTTWLVVSSIVLVTVLFAIMVFLIRFT